MRRLTIAALLAGAMLLSSGGCRTRAKKAGAEPVSEEPAGLVSMLHMADARAAVQLLRGFHEVEHEAWRWAAGDFAVTLKVPKDASKKGANLILKFSVADVSIQRFGALNVSAKVDSMELPPEKYAAAGPATYTREIPASDLSGESVTVAFHVDKFIPSSDSDQRDLAVIVQLIGLEVK